MTDRDEGRTRDIVCQNCGAHWSQTPGNVAAYCPLCTVRAPTSDTEDVGEEIADFLSHHCIDFQAIPEDAGDTYDWLTQQILARLRRTPEMEALVKRFRRPAEIPHYGPDADGFWLLRRCDVIALLEGREPLATQDPNAGGEDE